MSAQLYIPRRAGFSVVVSSHTIVTRASYTMPAGHTGILEYVWLRLVETTALGLGAGRMQASINGVRIARVDTLNAVGDHHLEIPIQHFLDSGDLVIIETIQTTAVITETYEGVICVKEYQ